MHSFYTSIIQRECSTCHERSSHIATPAFWNTGVYRNEKIMPLAGLLRAVLFNGEKTVAYGKSWLKLWITSITPHSILQSNEHTGSADGTRAVLHSNVCWLLPTQLAFPTDAFPNFNTYKTFSWVLKKAEVVCISHNALIEALVLMVIPCCFESFTEWLTYKRPKPLTAADKAPKKLSENSQ